MACLRIAIFLLFVAAPSYADIGLICTLNGEMEQILKETKVEDKVIRAKRDFYKGTLGNERVVLVRSPMGKVNNTVTAQVMVSNFNIDTIISIGFGGAIDESLKIGDIVISTDAVQHDFGTIKPYGFVWGKTPEIGESAILSPKRWAASKGYYYGNIVSGDQFIASHEKREWLRKKFGAHAVDMGAAAIYEVCKQNEIKCLFIRVISDKADVEGRLNFNTAAQNENYKSVEVLKDYLSYRRK